MSALNAILVQANVRRALIVDDAYDQVPVADDLSVDSEEWTHFFEDLTAEDRAILGELYPSFDNTRADALRVSDDFVAVLWNGRGRLRSELVGPLFARYETDTGADRAYLATLLGQLTGFGLDCDTAGRTFKEKARIADIVIIDLYLGSVQGSQEIDASINGLVDAIRTRPARPPLVVLMSRSSRLEAQREDFRERSGLFESTFRILRKSDLVDSGKLQRLLSRLASHYTDSLKLAAFLEAWQSGLERAGKRTSGLIRTLDLPDLAQIRQLLLSAEGEPTGSYLVDVFDRVLQHEIEGEAPIINAAITLNALTSDSYPPPYVGGSPDLQTLVHRCLFQNHERLRLIGAEGSRVTFGDLLRRKAPDAAAAVETGIARRGPLNGIESDNVLAVVTPPCDLQRQGAKNVLLLVGSLRALQPADWSYKDDPVRTPVIELSDGRFWIKWNLKHIETVSHAEIDEALAAPGGFETVARLRESQALEVQQKLLSSLGRVGLVAPMPATFRMRVEAYLPNAEKKLFRLDVPALSSSDGVCYVGRQGQNDMRLILCEDACEGLCELITKVDIDSVHPDARSALTYLRDSGELLQALERGVSLPSPKQENYKDIVSPSGATTGQGQNPGQNPRVRAIGLIARNKPVDGETLSGGETPKAGVVLATWDQYPEAAIVNQSTRSGE